MVQRDIRQRIRTNQHPSRGTLLAPSPAPNPLQRMPLLPLGPAPFSNPRVTIGSERHPSQDDPRRGRSITTRRRREGWRGKRRVFKTPRVDTAAFSCLVPFILINLSLRGPPSSSRWRGGEEQAEAPLGRQVDSLPALPLQDKACYSADDFLLSKRGGDLVSDSAKATTIPETGHNS